MCPTSLLFSFTFKLTSAVDIDLPLVVDPEQEGGREGGRKVSKPRKSLELWK